VRHPADNIKPACLSWPNESASGPFPNRPVGCGTEERRLYFNAETMLLARTELHARLSTGTEMSSEQTWDDYNVIDGIAVPHRVTHTMKDSGGTSIERVYRDLKFVEQLESHLFNPP
jgi:hypothetical protein